MSKPEPRRELAGAMVAGLFLAASGAGRQVVAALIAIVCVLAYWDLRTKIGKPRRVITRVLGAMSVLASLWVAYDGRLERLVWVAGALVLILLATWVVLHEVTGRSDGAIDDISATIAASGVVGLLGAHIFLVRSVQTGGFRGLVALATLVLVAELGMLVGDRTISARSIVPGGSRTWSGVGVGLASCGIAGAIIGILLNPPFTIASGLVFGAGVGGLTPIGEVVFGAIGRAPAIEKRWFGNALDASSPVLFVAPVFYWAFRTISL